MNELKENYTCSNDSNLNVPSRNNKESSNEEEYDASAHTYAPSSKNDDHNREELEDTLPFSSQQLLSRSKMEEDGENETVASFVLPGQLWTIVIPEKV
jgi:hypothetical protein